MPTPKKKQKKVKKIDEIKPVKAWALCHANMRKTMWWIGTANQNIVFEKSSIPALPKSCSGSGCKYIPVLITPLRSPTRE